MASAHAATIAPIAPIFSTEEGAIRGYDPVAYFKQNKALKGRADLSYTWQGAQWYFASQANLDAFKEKPEQFAPQYGGYCAYGVAQDYTPEIDPQAYKVIHGKLYLNLSKAVLKKWQKDIPSYVKDADKNWVTIQPPSIVIPAKSLPSNVLVGGGNPLAVRSSGGNNFHRTGFPPKTCGNDDTIGNGLNCRKTGRN